MRWSEFKSLFTKDKQRIRNEYRLKKAKRPGNKKEAEKASEMFEKVFWEMAGLNTSELSRQ